MVQSSPLEHDLHCDLTFDYDNTLNLKKHE
jgi:hypothetical protein